MAVNDFPYTWNHFWQNIWLFRDNIESCESTISHVTYIRLSEHSLFWREGPLKPNILPIEKRDIPYIRNLLYSDTECVLKVCVDLLWPLFRTAKKAQNGHFPKFWNFDFSMKVQDMKIGVGLDENTSLGHVLKWLRHIHHSNCKYPPAIFQRHENSRFLPLILAEIRKSTLWSTPVDQNFWRKI